MTIRTGLGYDIHRLVRGRPLMIGGVHIPFEFGLDGHSDADVLLHAISDALLGAAALGDIGVHFPPSDPALKSIDSRKILEASGSMVRRENFEIVNIDSTVIAEQPKIGPHVPDMRHAISESLGIALAVVSIKATTHEGLGSLGRQEGIAAMAIASLRPAAADCE